MPYRLMIALHNRATRWWILSFILFCLLVIGAISWGVRYFEGSGPLPRLSTVIIPKGTGFTQIADLLADAHVIRYPRMFQLTVVLNGQGRNFQAGEYEFPALVSPKAVMEAMLEGRTVIHRITIPEGTTASGVAAMLAGIEILQGDLPWSIPEGSLLPETYNFSYGDQRETMISRMQAKMQRNLDTLWEKRQDGLPFTTQKEAVTLASIVEKETGIASERGRIASVFINRLRKGMKLQADPTVIYAITSGVGKMSRLLTREDLQIDSPYNTYLNTGLPPGPICNPGLAALKAVLNPPSTNDLYFVADGSGGHSFSATLKQHNASVTRYRKLMKSK